MLFRKGSSEKQYWAYRKTTLEEALALQNRLFGKDFFLSERFIWKKNIPEQAFQKGVTSRVGVPETFFWKGHSKKQKRWEVQHVEMYLVWIVGGGECQNLCRRWKNTSVRTSGIVGTFGAVKQVCCGKRKRRNGKVCGRKKGKKMKKIQGVGVGQGFSKEWEVQDVIREVQNINLLKMIGNNLQQPDGPKRDTQLWSNLGPGKDSTCHEPNTGSTHKGIKGPDAAIEWAQSSIISWKKGIHFLS